MDIESTLPSPLAQVHLGYVAPAPGPGQARGRETGTGTPAPGAGEGPRHGAAQQAPPPLGMVRQVSIGPEGAADPTGAFSP